MAAVSMCSDSEGFTRWLEARLLQLNDDLDAGVFVTYINGILESYSGYDEKKDSLLDIVGEIAEDSKEEICDEVIKKWDEMCNVDSKENKKEPNRTPLDERLSKMLTNTHVVTSSTEKKAKQLSEEELAQKRAILVQYSTVCDEPDQGIELSEPEPVQSGATTSIPGNMANLIPAASAAGSNNLNPGSSVHLLVNTNRDSIQRQEKEMREKMKQDNEKKKEKDKLDREAQKNKRQERKENEKKRTQKGEKRR
ncbi:coiled-coil domain-containing protein 43 isoform X1 [Octopus sinensis]|uniref:Coiled-coil domain-containing protein 43 n=1 Tax=Octopus sinensis TaxID=2607531 RepID=A0A6P7TNN8_9MOLL|nr:coiled-coil domain-containing protein 43 isoform X1 [Octopus sinensis]